MTKIMKTITRHRTNRRIEINRPEPRTIIKVADSNFFLRILSWRISSYYNSVLFNYIPLELSNKNTMSPALGTNEGRSKSTTIFMHFCIECNGKSLKFDTIAKIKETSVLEIFLSL